MPTSRAGRAASQRGFAYPLVIVAACVLGIMAGVTGSHVAQTVQRDREAELLFRGQAYMRAIRSYYEAEPEAKRRSFPRSLEDLLQDPRFPNRRHLRRLYQEPFSSGEDPGWRLLRASDGGIAGVSSASRQEPLQKRGFPPQLVSFGEASSYQDWLFQYEPTQMAGAAAQRSTP